MKLSVAVDKRGDLLQWDHRQSEPIKVLGGRNIIKVALTPYKIYALSSSGKVFVLSSTSIPKAQSTSSWLLSWVWNSPHGAEHLELKTDKSLGMREHVRDIQAGTSHILALTSSGRCFSSPVDMRANEMGQLGVRSVHLAGVGNTQLYPQGFNPNEVATPDNRALSMELAQAKAMPRNWLSDETKSQLDQSEEASRLSEAAQQAAKVARQQYALAEQHIGFSQTLYEIPSLRNLKIAQIAVGDQHNLVKTQHGRVLAFGSNSCESAARCERFLGH